MIKTILFLNNQRAAIFWLLLASLVLLGSTYVYLINDSVFNIVAIEKNNEANAALQSQLSTLESSYLALSGKLTMPLAQTMGFKDGSSQTTFVSRQNPTVSLADLSHGEL